MPDGTNFSMATFTSGTNEDYLIHVIAVLRIIEKKGIAEEFKAAWLALPAVRKEMAPFLQISPDESEEAKKLRKASVEQYKGFLKAKKGMAIAMTSQTYKMFRLFGVGDDGLYSWMILVYSVDYATIALQLCKQKNALCFITVT
jgi:hypothetical protein